MTTTDPYANITDAQVQAAVETLRAAGVETVAGHVITYIGSTDAFLPWFRALLCMRADLLRAESNRDRFKAAIARVLETLFSIPIELPPDREAADVWGDACVRVNEIICRAVVPSDLGAETPLGKGIAAWKGRQAS